METPNPTPTPTPAPATAPLLPANQPLPGAPATPSATPSAPATPSSKLPYIIIGVAVIGLLYILLSDGSNGPNRKS